VLGFEVMGIWPDGSDGTDVNACDRSGSGRHLVTTDDFGGVNLFNHPCVVGLVQVECSLPIAWNRLV
jgi:hypothetical protein